MLSDKKVDETRNYRMKKIKSFLIGATLLHLLWIYGHYFVNSNIIPTPLTVYRSMGGEFWIMMLPHIFHSLWRLLLSLLISIITGLVLGLILAQSTWAQKLLTPFIYFTYPIPKMAFLPLVMVVMGMRNPSIITMIILIIVFQIIINVRDGVNAIPEEMYQPLKVLGASKLQLFFNVTFPAALSSILSSTRVALGTATSILFITENTGIRYGIGRFIFDAQSRIAWIQVFSGIVVLSSLAFILFLLLDLLESRFMKWK